MIRGSLIPDAGSVFVDSLYTGADIQRSQVRRQMAIYFQPGSREVDFGLRSLGLEREEINSRVGAALKMVSMEDYTQYPPYLLSGGQKIRIWLLIDADISMPDPEEKSSRQIGH